MARPAFRQFGSKARVASRILALVPPSKRIWCEVFAGTAAVTLAKPPHPEEHINDLNGDIVNLFRVLRDDAARARLIAQVSMTPWSEGEYRACRAAPALGDLVERARRYLVLSWQGFNGDSLKGTGWISFDGSSKARPRQWDDLPERLAQTAARLKWVNVHQKPALEMLQRIGRYSNAVAFVDPPYPVEAINGQRRTYRVDMTNEEHEAFGSALRRCECAVLMTMARGTLYDEVLSDWCQQDLPVQTLSNAVKLERVFMNFAPRRGLFDESMTAEAR